jgi:hypothetical protein
MRIWQEKTDPTKKIIYFNGKWQLISSPENFDYYRSKGFIIENISALIEFFQSKGSNRAELGKIFKNIFECQAGTNYYQIYCSILEKHFIGPEDKKLAPVYYRHFPKRTKKRMRPKKEQN